ncbi:MAG: hypothetical protein HN712_22270 [Gemmatimonadetes bacterium]|nr:hypothetical protein [Gemmatimonadota bacterium]
MTWEAAELPPLQLSRRFPSVDFRRIDGGLAPLDSILVVPVPRLDGTGLPSSEELRSIEAFGRHVSRDSVIATRSVPSDGVSEGDLLLAPLDDFPRTPHRIRLLELAGIDSVNALVNLMHATLSATDQRARKKLLWSPSIFRFLGSEQVEENLGRVVDADATSAFLRIDQPGRNVSQKGLVIFMDLAARYPVAMVRFYPRPEVGLRVNSYRIDVNDGIAVIGGGGRLRDEPAFSLLQVEQSNLADTVTVRVDPPRHLQRFRFESLTSLDYDMSEFEVFGRGFAAVAQYTTHPLPFDRAALPAMRDYLDGDLEQRQYLDGLPGPVLGMVEWDEAVVGDPSESSVTVSMQTGVNPEPLKLFRVSTTGAIVEWRPGAIVTDHRVGETSFGNLVNLDDEDFQSAARDIWDALSEYEQADAQTTTPEYIAIPAGAKLNAVGGELPSESNRGFWSAFQPLRNGELIQLPAGRRFFQIRVTMESKSSGSSTSIRNLRFEQEFRRPVRRTSAELVPAADLTAGVDTTVVFALRPFFGPGDVGFNRLRVETPTRVSRVDAVEFGYGHGSVQQLTQLEEVEFSQWSLTDSSFVVGFPKVDEQLSRDDSLVVLVRFRVRPLGLRNDFPGQLFLDTLDARESTTFSRQGMLIVGGVNERGERVDSTRVLPQRVESGDVVDFAPGLSDRNSLQALARIDQPIGSVLSGVQIKPNPFSPNGDGINDDSRIRFDVLRITGQVSVMIEIFDLSGRLIRRFESERAMGEHEQVWDGRDMSSMLVSPGIYLARISVETDTGRHAVTRLLSVVY